MSGGGKPGLTATLNRGWWHTHKWLVLRRVSQFGILGLFLLGPLAGVRIIDGNLSSSLLLDTVPMTDPLLFLQMLVAGFLVPAGTAVLGAALVLGFYLLVGGRVFCSWVCPVNLVTDGAGWLRLRLDLHSGINLARSARYWMLALVLLLALVTGSLAYELVNPVSLLHRGIIFGLGSAAFVALALFLFDLFVARRGWCGHLCPMGAFYGLVGAVSPVRVRADQRAACDDCMECFVVCPEPQVIRPALKGAEAGRGPVILAGECTNCGRCIEVCPQEVFAFGLRYPNRERGQGSQTRGSPGLSKGAAT
jgi:ferredoxin-type protein NapH